MLQQKCGGYKYSATGGSLTGETVSGNRGVVNKVFFRKRRPSASLFIFEFDGYGGIGKWG